LRGPGRNDYVAATNQQKIGEAYSVAFLRSQLLMRCHEDMLRGRMTFPSTAGYKIYGFRHEKSFLKLDDGTAAGAVSGATQSVVANPSRHQTQAIKLDWSVWAESDLTPWPRRMLPI
jgi:hypothetical protein